MSQCFLRVKRSREPLESKETTPDQLYVPLCALMNSGEELTAKFVPQQPMIVFDRITHPRHTSFSAMKISQENSETCAPLIRSAKQQLGGIDVKGATEERRREAIRKRHELRCKAIYASRVGGGRVLIDAEYAKTTPPAGDPSPDTTNYETVLYRARVASEKKVNSVVAPGDSNRQAPANDLDADTEENAENARALHHQILRRCALITLDPSLATKPSNSSNGRDVDTAQEDDPLITEVNFNDVHWHYFANCRQYPASTEAESDDFTTVLFGNNNYYNHSEKIAKADEEEEFDEDGLPFIEDPADISYIRARERFHQQPRFLRTAVAVYGGDDYDSNNEFADDRKGYDTGEENDFNEEDEGGTGIPKPYCPRRSKTTVEDGWAVRGTNADAAATSEDDDGELDNSDDSFDCDGDDEYEHTRKAAAQEARRNRTMYARDVMFDEEGNAYW